MTLYDTRRKLIYTPDEVAEILTCSKAHVYRLIRSGALVTVDISNPGGKQTKHRIRSEDLGAYLSSLEPVVRT